MRHVTLLLFFVGSALFAQDAATPSAQEIADAYIENTGGVEAWKAVTATKMEGTAAMQGMEFPLTVTAAAEHKNRVDVDIQGSPMIQSYDGTTGWLLFPMQGITEPKEMTEEEVKAMAETPFLSEFIDSEERGYVLESVAGKEVEGTPTYGIRVTKGEDYDRTYYFETENMVPILVEATAKSGPTKGMMGETYLSDYQEVDNLIMPMFIEQKFNGQSAMKMTFTTITLNPELEEGFFSMPE